MSLTNEQIKELESIYPKLSSVIQSLEQFVKEDILAELVEIQEIVHGVFEEQWDAEDEDFDKEFTLKSEIADKEKFKSIWSISEVKAAELDGLFSKTNVKGIAYESWGDKQEISFGKAGKKMTWMDMWREADKLIRQSGDTHHIFIEMFYPDKVKKGYYNLICGS
jgi:hypothetical protein